MSVINTDHRVTTRPEGKLSAPECCYYGTHCCFVPPGDAVCPLPSLPIKVENRCESINPPVLLLQVFAETLSNALCCPW